MLVLARRIGESIEITGGIQITVTAVRGGIVKLGFEAPDYLNIVRSELLSEAALRREFEAEGIHPIEKKPDDRS